ncbi:MAG: hypothetical protein ACK559_12600, partial [bacterium]
MIAVDAPHLGLEHPAGFLAAALGLDGLDLLSREGRAEPAALEDVGGHDGRPRAVVVALRTVVADDAAITLAAVEHGELVDQRQGPHTQALVAEHGVGVGLGFLDRLCGGVPAGLVVV